MPSNIAVGVAGVKKCNSAVALNVMAARSIAGGTNTAFRTIEHGKPSTMDGDQNTVNYSLNGVSPANGVETLGQPDTVELGGEVTRGLGIANPLGGNNTKISDYQLVDTNYPVKRDLNFKSVDPNNITPTIIYSDKIQTGVTGLGDNGSKYGRTRGYSYTYRSGPNNTTKAFGTITQ